MKKFTLLLALCFSFSLLQAQFSLGKLFIKKIGLSTGFDQDRIKNMDADYFLGTARGSENSAFNDTDFPAETLYGGVCENPYLRAYVTLGAPNVRNTYLDLALVGVFNRYDAMYYSNSQSFWDFGDDYEYLSMSALSNEVMLEGVLTRELDLANWFKLYGGLGTNLGYSFGGYMSVDGHLEQQTVDDNLERDANDIFTGSYHRGWESEYYQLKNAFAQRIFVEVGTGLILFKRLESGIFVRRGVGYRSYLDYGTRGVNLHSFGLRLNWIINK